MRKKVEDSEKAKEQAEKVQEEMKKKIEDLEEAKKLVTESSLKLALRRSGMSWMRK